jgi:cytochrome c553
MMNFAKSTALLIATLALGGCQGSSQTASDHGVAGTIHLCSSCHGMTGVSTSPDFPILAGQQRDYLAAQLHAFRDQTRADPHAHTYMWGMAKHLDDATITGVAAYFAAQPLAAQIAGPAVAPKLFSDGDDGRGIPACIACHGAKAEGQDAIPRLAGQHEAYLAEQLEHFRSNARANETMHMNAVNLTDEEIRTLARYLSAL